MAISGAQDHCLAVDGEVLILFMLMQRQIQGFMVSGILYAGQGGIGELAGIHMTVQAFDV